MTVQTMQPSASVARDLLFTNTAMSPEAAKQESSSTSTERVHGGNASASLAGRVAAFTGAGVLLGAAVGNRSRGALAAAAAAVLPLAYRGVTGRWPLPRRPVGATDT